MKQTYLSVAQLPLQASRGKLCYDLTESELIGKFSSRSVYRAFKQTPSLTHSLLEQSHDLAE